MAKRKVCVVITARPSYSRIKTALEAIKEHDDLELQLVVAASALLERYGAVVKSIEEDGFVPAARVFNVLEGENLAASAKTTGLGILELSSAFDQLKPDVIVTVADRFETMATAIAASYMNFPLVHVQGGEVTGNIDEKVRHAITKLADFHFVCSASAKERVEKMGEDPAYVYNTGCPSIDIARKVMEEEDTPDLGDYFRRYGGVGPVFDPVKGYLVVMQHPVTTEYADARQQVLNTLQAISTLGIPTIWFWPNVDAGSDGTSKGIRSFREKNKEAPIHFFKNMEPYDFLRLLKHSLCLVGNSSVGMRECAYLGTPVVNIGSRQFRRDRGHNVVDCGYEAAEIAAAVKKQAGAGRYESDMLYGTGDAGKAIADLLSKIKLRFHKTITY